MSIQDDGTAFFLVVFAIQYPPKKKKRLTQNLWTCEPNKTVDTVATAQVRCQDTYDSQYELCLYMYIYIYMCVDNTYDYRI